MKKIFKFAALAAFILPLMVACKTKNGPDDPKQPDEEFQEWIEEGSENEVTVSEKNICGIWKLCQKYTADADLNYLDGQNVDDPYDNIHCLEIKEDNTFIDYFYNSGLGTSNGYGTWNLTGKQFSYEYTVYPESGSLKSVLNGKYMVFRCEPEELALSYSETTQRIWNNGKDSIGTITYFSIFKRLYELPELPKPLAEVIVANPWKVLSDTMYLGKTVWVETESFMGDVYQPVKVEQTNMIPVNAVFTFAADSTMEIKDANGDIIGKGRYDIRRIGSSIYLSTDESHVEMWIDIQDEDGYGDFSHNGKEIIPGLPNTLNIFVDPSNENRIIVHEEQELPANEQKDGLTLRGWVYHLEAIK